MPSPVGKQRSQNHQGVLHQRHDFRGCVTAQQKFSAVLEGSKLEREAAPVSNDLLQLGFDVLLFHGTDADVLHGRHKGITAHSILGWRIQGIFPQERKQGTNHSFMIQALLGFPLRKKNGDGEDGEGVTVGK